MTQKVVAIEEKDGPLRAMLQNMMRMVPDRDRDDVNLQRLLAFRLRLDGEAALKEYLMTKIRAADQCASPAASTTFSATTSRPGNVAANMRTTPPRTHRVSPDSAADEG
jgi:hypothetical protein